MCSGYAEQRYNAATLNFAAAAAATAAAASCQHACFLLLLLLLLQHLTTRVQQQHACMCYVVALYPATCNLFEALLSVLCRTDKSR
jgi:hypothetical protein